MHIFLNINNFYLFEDQTQIIYIICFIFVENFFYDIFIF